MAVKYLISKGYGCSISQELLEELNVLRKETAATFNASTGLGVYFLISACLQF